MSRTRNQPGDPSPGPNRAYFELSRMLQEGRSWSGRERNACFLNTRGPRFANVSAASGLDFPDDGRAVALTDWDQDGDVDLWTSNRNAPRLRLLRNDAGREHRSLALRLTGDGLRTNRDAIGARVEVVAAGSGTARLVRTLRAGEGFIAQSSKWLHFGLGLEGRIEKVVVRWPGGGTEEIAGLEPGGRYTIVQGSGKAEPWAGRSGIPRLEASEQVPRAASEAARVPPVALLRMPRIGYVGFDGAQRTVPLGRGKPVLVSLWASWCAPCAAELGELARRAREVERAGLEVAALAVDGLGGDRSDPARAAAMVREIGFPFAAGRATEGIVRLLQRLHDAHLALHKPLPVPASFLADAEGRLAVIYKGRAPLDQVLADIGESRLSRPSPLSRRERVERAAAPLGGSTLSHPVVEEAAATAEATVRFQLALDLARAGLEDAAAAHYEDLLELKPDLAEAHSNLGLLDSQKGDWAGAEGRYRKALEFRPDLPEGHYNLGTALERRGDLRGAEARYRRALELKPGYPEAHNTLGLLLARQGREAEAEEQFRLETERNPRFAPAHNHLGIVFLERGDAARAEALFREALRLDAKLADAHSNLGIALKRQGRIEEAAAEYAEAVRLEPTFAEARNNLGAVLLGQGKLAEAEEQFERALEARPDFTEARRNLERTRALRRERGGR